MKTKVIFAYILFFALSSGAFSQDEMQTLINPNNEKEMTSGGYGAIRFGYTTIDGLGAFTTGLRGGWIINHRFVLGGAMNGFTNGMHQDKNSKEYFTGGGWGGIFFSPIIRPNSVFHIAFPILIGGGGVASMPKDFQDYNHDNFVYDYDGYFVFEPAVELEFNVASFFRLAAGVSYRLTNGINLSFPYKEVSSTALNSFNYYMIFKFGKF